MRSPSNGLRWDRKLPRTAAVGEVEHASYRWPIRALELSAARFHSACRRPALSGGSIVRQTAKSIRDADPARGRHYPSKLLKISGWNPQPAKPQIVMNSPNAPITQEAMSGAQLSVRAATAAMEMAVVSEASAASN